MGVCVQGLVSVRAFRLQEGFHARHNALLDASTRCWWPLMSVNRWLSIRLEFLGTTLVLCTAVAATVLLPRRCTRPPPPRGSNTKCCWLSRR